MDQAPSAPSVSAPDPTALAATRQRLHGIGECLMAEPQRRAGGRFTLRVTPGGFATTGEPALRLDGTEVVVDESRHVAVAGTFSELADALGVDFGPPPDPYPDGSEASPGDDTTVGVASATLVQECSAAGDGTTPDADPVARAFRRRHPPGPNLIWLLARGWFPCRAVCLCEQQRPRQLRLLDRAVRSRPQPEQMRSVADLVTFWRKAQSLLKPHG
jgi:hypothetical protein